MRQGRRPARLPCLLALLPAALLPASCASVPQADPISWWHGLEGGPIAQQRPPPPGTNLPYPSLGTVPERPKPIDPDFRNQLTARLASDRADATYEAQQEPLATPAKSTSGLFAPAAPLSAPSADNAGAALQATEPPATPATAPARTAAAQPPPAPVAEDAPLPAAPQASPAPAIPDAPPPAPQIAGVAIPRTVAHLPPRAPAAATPAQPALTEDTAAPIGLAFATGSALLLPATQSALHTLAGRRNGHGMEVLGFGDADTQGGTDPVAALRLAQSRTRAVATALLQAGVPMSALHLAADATGRGAAVRLID